LLVLLGLLLQSRPLVACSSCGSGGADPLVLNPSESQKIYLGLGLQHGFEDFDGQGIERANFGAERKWASEVAFAQRLSSRLFGSAVTGFGFNQKHSRQQNGQADSSLNLRFTALQPSMVETLWPQVQLILSHRFATGRSIQESKKESYLDVFGAGYDETYLGTDIWWGMLPVMFGGSYLYGVPVESNTPNGRLKVGRLQRAILTVGALVQPEVKLIGGAIGERRGGGELDGILQTDSDRRTQDVFVTLETLYPEGDNWRFTLTRKAAFGELKNASRFWGLTAAWMRTL
jgi:hypothetical protein